MVLLLIKMNINPAVFNWNIWSCRSRCCCGSCVWSRITLSDESLYSCKKYLWKNSITGHHIS